MSTRPKGVPPELHGFEFVRVLGSGGFSDVFLFEQQLPRRPVAVKVILADGVAPADRAAFVAEADVMARLSSHPYIVSIHQAGFAADDRPYIVMEYYGGPSLADQYKAQPLGVAGVLRAGVRLASAIATAHAAGILHRDIKPANVLSNEYGRPGLTDFGIASRLEDEAALHTVTRLRGEDTGGTGARSVGLSVPWSPPEMFDHDPTPDVRSDVFSLAATLHTLLAGRSPFEIPGGRNRSADLIARIERGEITPIGRDDVPASLTALLRRAMATNRDQRPASALEFARSLQRIELELGYPATPVEIPGLDVPAVTEKMAATAVDDETRLREPRPATVQTQTQTQTQTQPPPPTPPSVDAETTVRATRVPAEPARRTRVPTRLVAGVVVGALVLVVATVLIVTAVMRPPTTTGPDAAESPTASGTLTPEPAVEADPRPTTATLPQLDIFAVPVGIPEGATRSDFDGVQKFADGVARPTTTENFITYCWTVAPDTIRDRYGTDQARGAIIDAFRHQPTAGSTGVVWTGEFVTLTVSDEELRSAYACPWVTINGEPDRYDRIDAEYLITRLNGRTNGTPVDGGDTEANYPLRCEQNPLAGWTLPDSAVPGLTRDAPPIDIYIDALEGARLSVTEVPSTQSPEVRYWKLTAVGTTGPSLVVQSLGARVCLGAGTAGSSVRG